MNSHRPRRLHTGVARLLFFFLAAVLALIGFGPSASAAPVPTTGTRVEVPAPKLITTVGVADHIAAGQHPDRAPPQPAVAQGHGVHTYYVQATGADGAPGTAVLVHNTGCGTAKPWELSRTEALSGNPSSRKVQELAASMRENGWQGDPIEVFIQNGERYIVNGHHRAAAARLAGIDVPYRALSLDEIAAYGYRSADEVVAAASQVGPNRLR